MSEDRFKFRVWNPIHKRYDHSFFLDTDGVLWGGHCPRESAIIEQCTGLEDKNGNLIYEGDLVSLENGTAGEVLMRDCCWWVDDGWSTLLCHAMGMEITGNIHEGLKGVR